MTSFTIRQSATAAAVALPLYVGSLDQLVLAGANVSPVLTCRETRQEIQWQDPATGEWHRKVLVTSHAPLVEGVIFEPSEAQGRVCLAYRGDTLVRVTWPIKAKPAPTVMRADDWEELLG